MAKIKELEEDELTIARKEIATQKEANEKLSAELILVRKELVFQNEEKGKRAEELIIADKELAFQKEEKGKVESPILENESSFYYAGADPSEQKKVENVLQESEEKFKLIFEKSISPIMVADDKGNYLEVNKAAAEIFEYSINELMSMNVGDLITTSNPNAVAQYEEYIKKGEEIGEFGFISKKGTPKIVQYQAVRIKPDFNLSILMDVTEQKKSSQYTRSLIEASLDPLVTISVDGKITDVNEASIKVTGVEREKLIDTDFSNYFTEPTKAQEGYLQVFEKGFVADYPLTIKHKNGNLIDVLYNASVYKDDKGNVLGVFAAARDVTSQKQASQYARSLIEASLDPLVTISVDGKITDVNEASIKVTGVEREKLIDTDFSIYFTEPQKAQEGYRQVFENGFVADYPLTIKHKNGNLTDVLYNASVYKDDKGNVLGVFAAARDVTEQKWAKDLRIANKELAFQNDEKEKRAAELIIANKELAFQNGEKEKRAAELIVANKELVIESDEKERRADQLTLANLEIQRNYEEHFSQMADLMPDKITTTNADGQATFFNQNWIDYSGYTFEELIGFGWNHILHPDETAEIQKRWTQSLTTGEDFEMEMQCLSKNDGYKWFLTRAVPIKEANGVIKSWIGTSTEIQRGKEEQQRKDNFIKMVSHELKTPVTSIKGYVQLLLMILSEEPAESFPIQIKNSLLRVDHQITRLTRLITEMLDLSRIEAGKLELQQELFSLNALVKDTVDDISLTNPKHTIHLLFEFNCNMYGDRGRIEQVVINLVTNAIKYSANNNKVEVSIRKGERNMVLVSVRDFGIGIDKADHKKIFDRFFRVEGKMEQTFAGFGIGLFIAKEIIVRHNGYITVESEKGQGSVFTFAFPYTTETNL
jgi:PAS domain S-box-containing protein